MADPRPDIRMDPTWRDALRTEFDSDYMAALRAFLVAEKKGGTTVFPPSADWFRALELTPLPEVRVVILGQDPYHGAGQAHGLCFSVKPGVKPPPSLINIYKELASDCGIVPPAHGFLESWARQGVLLLNSVLTVASGRAASHRERGWERFTDAIVRRVAEKDEPVVFMLWGSYAQKKAGFVKDVAKGGRHLVLKAPHPSPLSAYNGWFGSGHFSKANAFLAEHGRGTIDWALPERVG
ncbi:uracil-DNA glycosylase [Sphingomonas endophytica]|uniref:Uracil-DNA glycosylase n=1 Tax=Sphingomonas endophytica TaxID=869719 RepID=A0A147I847_9SPHN|nr:uracil-DNA glycosylase [Sphingomonas endophytica]KTT75221.1 uracil-DNA glycosylase [Sphingomonas endophytica]